MPPMPSRQEIEPKLTIEPPPAAIMPGAIAWMAKNWCLQVDGDPGVPAFRGLALPVVAGVVGGVVDEDRGRPERLGDLRDRRLQGRDVGDVGRHEAHRGAGVAELAGKRLAALPHDVDEADLGALAGEGAHDRLADAAGAAGDEAPCARRGSDRWRRRDRPFCGSEVF